MNGFPRLAALASPARLAVLASLLLSALALAGRGSLNDDGILYLLTAQAYIDGGLAAAAQAYPWPFHSALIGLLSRLGLSLQAAADLLNAGLFALLCGAFVALAERLYPGARRLHWLAALAVLLLPELNGLRGLVLRDTGFLAFWLLSLLGLLQHLDTRRWVPLAGALAALAAAQLFRIEAGLFALAAVLALLTLPGHRQTAAALAAALVLAAALAVAGLEHWLPGSRLDELPHWWAYYTSEMVQHFEATATRLSERVLGRYAGGDARDALLAVLAGLFLAKLVKVLTPVHLALLALKPGNARLTPPARRMLLAYGLAALALPLVFLLRHHFLTQRFVLPLALLLLLLVPARLDHLLFQRLGRPALRWGVAGLLLALFVYGSGHNLPAGKSLVREAAAELRGRLGAAPLWTNDKALTYYLGRATAERHRHYPWPEWRSRWAEDGAAAEWLLFLVQAEDGEALAAEVVARGWQPAGAYADGRQRVLAFRRAAPAEGR